jgi:hypothetical protein
VNEMDSVELTPVATATQGNVVAASELARPEEAHEASSNGTLIAPAAGRGTCEACAAAAADGQPESVTSGYSYVYAIGRIEPRFPSPGVEKEFAQATGRAETAGLTDRQALSAVLTEQENRYLARQLCYVLTVAGLDTYILMPRTPGDHTILIDALRSEPGSGDRDVVVGVRGGLAPPEVCNGLEIPVVGFDQIYSFDVDSFISAMPRPEGMTAEDFEPKAADLLDRVMQIRDNAGGTPQHRALNYLAVRYPAVYTTTAEAFGRNSALTSVQVRRSPLSGVREVYDVTFTYTNRETDVEERYGTRVDVTEEFPFLVSKLAPFYEVFASDF